MSTRSFGSADGAHTSASKPLTLTYTQEVNKQGVTLAWTQSRTEIMVAKGSLSLSLC